MRFLVDESAGEAVTRYLRSAAHDVLSVAEITPRAEDIDILAWAVREERIVVTNDKDFGELVFRRDQAHHGILLFRLRDESAANQVRTLTAVLNQHIDRLANYFVVISDNDIRFHPKSSDPEQ